MRNNIVSVPGWPGRRWCDYTGQWIAGLCLGGKENFRLGNQTGFQKYTGKQYFPSSI